MTPILRTRREFLRTTAWGGAVAATVPAFLARTWSALGADAAQSALQPVTGKDGPILVVLQMAGGNDGLNTVVPFANDHYHEARKNLAIPAKDVLRIDDSIGLHPGLKGLHGLLQDGQAAVIQGVGYPNPNRSHFRSMEIWQTASDAGRYEPQGWLGRYFDHACRGCDPTVAVNVGRQMPQAFAARKPTGISLDAPGRSPGSRGPRGASMAGADADPASAGEPADGGSIEMLSGPSAATGAVLDFLDRTAMDAQVSSAKVREITSRTKNLAEYPPSRLGQSLKLVAQLIAGEMPTRIYYVSQGGFDTHTNQAGTHARLLAEFGDAVKAFVADLRAQGNLGRVLAMSFSEFGRRVAANASGGTDHGAAGPMFLLGARFATSLVGRHPGLAPSDLANGDLKHELDFRSVYAAVLDDWLKTPSVAVLGRKFEPVKLGV